MPAPQIGRMSGSRWRRFQSDLPTPVGPDQLSASIMNIVMATAAQEHKIGDVGGPVGLPWLHMMGLAPVDTGPAADTAAVAGDQSHPLGFGGRSVAAPNEDRTPRPVEQHAGEVGVAGQHLKKRLGHRGAVADDLGEPGRIR